MPRAIARACIVSRCRWITAARGPREHSDRQRDDGRAVDTGWTAADRTLGRDRLPDVIGRRLGDRGAERRQHGSEAEHAAAARIVRAGRMGMRWGGAVILAVRMLSCACGRATVIVM